MAEWSTSNKGEKCILLDGYSMLKHTLSPDKQKVYYRCSKHKNGCSARGVAPVASLALKMTAGHNHLPTPGSPEKRKRVADLKRKASENLVTPTSSLAEDAQAGLHDALLQNFPSLRSLQRTAAKVRKVDMGKGCDGKPQDIVWPDPLTKTLRGQRFLLVDSRTLDPEKPMFTAFASDEGIQMLRENRNWSVDGTFFTAPKFVDSMVTINALVQNASLPGVYIFLPNRTQDTYERALDAIFATEQLTGVTPLTYISDMELAMVNAMRKAFPDADEQFCLFHLCKAIFDNIGKKRLLELYKSDDSRALLRCFSALAFLPTDEVSEGFTEIWRALKDRVQTGHIPRRLSQNIAEFARYFRNNYVGYTHQGHFFRARFDPASWNVFARALTDQPRTNNGTEGWHASLNANYPKSNLVMSQCVVRLQREEEKTRNLMIKHRGNPADPIRGRSKKDSHREVQLVALVKAYDSTPVGERDRLHYLQNVQLHLSEVAFSRLEAEILNDVENEPPCASHQATAADLALPTQSQSQRSQGTPVSSQQAETLPNTPTPSELALNCFTQRQSPTPNASRLPPAQSSQLDLFDSDDDAIF